MKLILLRTAIAVGCAVAASPALAGGILLYETGTADVGLASAGYGARAEDASTVFSNPAGMTRLKGTQLLFGGQVLYGDLGMTIGAGTSPELGSEDGGNPVGWFPGGGLYFSHAFSPTLQVGFATAGNFGLAQEYESGWVGRYYAQKSALIGVSLLPSIACKVSDSVSLGASLNVMYGKLEDEVAINNVTAPDGKLHLDDSTWGVGVNLGLLWELDARTRFGFTYSSEVGLDFNAPAEFTGLAPGLSSLLASRGLLDADVDLGMKVPQGVMASVFAQPNDRWAVLGSVGWQQWSKFGRVEVGIDSSDPVSLTTDLAFDDTWHAAAGAQARCSDAWSLDVGIAYASAFQSGSTVSISIPANAAWRFGVGARRQSGKGFRWGVAAEYAWGGTLDVSEQGSAPVALGGR